MRGDRQDQQKKLSDEQLVLNAQSDKTAIGELIARYICTVEFLAKKYGAEVHEDLVQAYALCRQTHGRPSPLGGWALNMYPLSAASCRHTRQLPF